MVRYQGSHEYLRAHFNNGPSTSPHSSLFTSHSSLDCASQVVRYQGSHEYFRAHYDNGPSTGSGMRRAATVIVYLVRGREAVAMGCSNGL